MLQWTYDGKMIKIQITYYNLAADLMNKKKEERELIEGSTCCDLVFILAGENERFRKLVLDNDGQLSNRVRIFRNEKIVTDINDQLFHNDKIIILPAISGG